MEQKITNNDIRKIITDLGGYVSVTDTNHPVTVIFTKVMTPVYIQSDNGSFVEDPQIRHEKFCLEMGIQCVESLDDFKQTVREILHDNTQTIFKLHSCEYRNGKYCIRYGHLNSWYGQQREITHAEAVELINCPPLNLSHIYITYLKAIYNL